MAVPTVSVESLIDDLNGRIEAASQDPSRPAADRLTEVRAIRGRLVTLLGACDRYRSGLDKLREAQDRAQHDDIAQVRLNADVREGMIARGDATAEELDEAGFLSHDELDLLAEEGLLQEAAGELARRTRPDPPVLESAVNLTGEPRVLLESVTADLRRLDPGATMRLPDGATIRRTRGVGRPRFKYRAGEEDPVRTITGVHSTAELVTNHYANLTQDGSVQRSEQGEGNGGGSRG